MEAQLASLRMAAARGRPVMGVGARLVEVPAALAGLFPEGGIRRGATVAVEPLAGGCSVALSLAGALTGRGGWAAVVGMPSLGLAAAAEMGVDLGRLALVPGPGEQWAAVVAALADGFDLLLVRPPGRVRPADARRLVARVREREAIMVLLDAPGWPESPDIRLSAGPAVWEGLGEGHGLLQARRMLVTAGGRRVGGRERRREVWLPARTGGMAEVTAAGPAPARTGGMAEVTAAGPAPAAAWEVAG